MTDPLEDLPELAPDERAFVEGVRRSYQAAPMSPARERAFDVAVADRATRRDGWQPGVWALTAAFASAVAVFFVMSTAPLQDPIPEPAAAPTALAAEAEPLTPEEVILALSSDDFPELDGEIPDDYEAIDALLLEGV
jgi:hypothetical protein